MTETTKYHFHESVVGNTFDFELSEDGKQHRHKHPATLEWMEWTNNAEQHIHATEFGPTSFNRYDGAAFIGGGFLFQPICEESEEIPE